MSKKPTYEELEQRIGKLEQAELERKHVEKELKTYKARLEAIWSFSSLAGADIKIISNHILKMIGEMTGSQYGFYGFVNEDESVMTIYSWSGDAMKDCTMVTKPTIFPISEAGVWGEAIRHRKPLILNHYDAKHPAKKGLPEGHVLLTNLLVVPFMSHSRITSVAAVANRAADYGENDIKQMRTFLSSIQALVDSKYVEEMLQRERKVLQALIDGAKNSHLVYLDQDFNFIRVNAAYADTCGYSPEEMIGKNHFTLYPHAENEAIFARVRDSGERFEVHDKPFEFPDQPERGTTYWDWTLTPVKNASGQVEGLIFSLFETTERIKNEATIRQLKKSESLGRMAGAIAHRFNNLLSVITGNLEMAFEDIPYSGLSDYLSEAMTAAKRASEVSGLMLRYLGQSTDRHEPLDLSRICQEFLVEFKSDLPSHATLKIDLPGEGPFIMGNSNQIQQVLKSILLNAQEALEDQTGVISLKISTIPSLELPSINRWPIDFQAGASEYVCLEVRDNGCGIGKDELEKIFDPFFSTKFTGRGLGLAVVMGTLKANRGCISVETEPDHGSSFRVFLPKKTQIEANYVDVQENHAVFAENCTVLLIDDEESVRKIGKAMLRRLGLNVMASKDGVEALGIFEKNKEDISCVLSDLTMPRMNGWETLEKLRRIAPEIPVILASGYDQAYVMKDAGSQLPQAFLKKPYDLTALKKALNIALDES